MVKEVKDLYRRKLILLECISGSTAYGLNLPHSDIDKRGVFYAPRSVFYGLEEVNQVSSDTGDDSFSELGRFFQLVLKNNPTMIELMNTPNEFVLTKHPLFERLTKEMYLSKLCKDTFAGYAITQIKKARGLNKKILNPMERQRKTVLDFCYVTDKQGSASVRVFLTKQGLKEANCGLSKVAHMTDTYALYYGINQQYRGIFKGEESNDVLLSSVGKQDEPIAYLFFNRSGYSKYCKDYKEYWEWVEKRNDARYHNTLSHGKNYDAKNMMHTFRLLHMSEEIASLGEVKVKRPDREFLLKIRSGQFDYEDLLIMAEEKIEEMKSAYNKSSLPDQPDSVALNNLLIAFREELYKG